MVNRSTTQTQEPGLFGLENSNRDFKVENNWGKNIFNNAFPVSLACYMHHKGVMPVYLTLNDEMEVDIGGITVRDLFNIEPLESDTFYSFESDFVPYQPLVVNNLPRADLVVINKTTGVCVRNIEIKLTALPDSSTADLPDDKQGCELVIRPDTIVYLALSIAMPFKDRRDELAATLKSLPVISDWEDIDKVLPVIPVMAEVLDGFITQNLHLQEPLILQPVWKTNGKLLALHPNALDIFVWSNFAFTRLFFRDAHEISNRLTRSARSVAWLTKMLMDFSIDGRFDHKKIQDAMSYNTKNDKAFAVNGQITHKYMFCDELVRPRVKKDEIKHIILGGGEQFLSPERRLDAAILNTRGLFD